MPKPKSWDPEVKRQKILNAAIKILNNKEYHKCPIDEIAKNAGVAKGTVYLYFKSKEELYFSILFMLTDKLNEMADDIYKSNLSASKKLLLFLEKQLDFMGKYRNIFMAVRQNLKSHKEKFHNALNKKINVLMDIVSQIIEKGKKDGEFKSFPSSSLAALYLSLMSVNIHQKIGMHNKMIEINITPQFIWDVFSKGIEK
ncbi:MAG: TetR/AcrR family transcriptional regulator [Elusimicrobia bacterium]|nr:TetR/AcrR family transcriptional regulator [Elusimicrobiota bacterium]